MMPLKYGKGHNNTTFTDYLRYLLHYVKHRSQVYIFVVSALLSLAVASRGSEIEPLLALRLALGTYLVSLATYAYNDVTDTLADRINRVDRILARSRVEDDHRAIKRLSMILFSIGMLLLVHINLYTATIALICTILAVAYSHPRTSLKDRFPYKTIVNASGAGLAALIGGFAADNLNEHVIILALISFLFLFVLAPLGDIQDYEGDRVAGKRTFPVVLGIDATIAIMLSIPLAVTLLFLSMNVSMISIAVTSTANIVSMLLILMVHRRWREMALVKTTRHILRLIYVINQISILLSAANIDEM